MPKIAYKTKSFREATLDLIAECNRLIRVYSSQGYNLTLRQLYYRLVATGKLENSYRSYKNLGEKVNDARLAGLIDWYGIEDRTRGLRSLSHWSNPSSIMKAVLSGFMIDRWQDQPRYLEVWVEKDALISVVGQACERWDVPYMSTRGYISQSTMWQGARRLARKADDGKEVVLIHLADHDPSGVDMTRDLKDRLVMFDSWRGVNVKRIALTMKQVRQYDPPAFWAKPTDSRTPEYVRNYGDDSWELDALEPATIDTLLDTTIQEYLDHDIWADTLDLEADMEHVLEQAQDLVHDLDQWVDGWTVLDG